MSQKPFKFKEFTVNQDRCAMKIGTDSVLLGAWASLTHQPDSILDIGTGTGVIALILAQRSPAMLIDALEIDEETYEQAVENFEQSNWGDRLFCYHAAFDEFVEEMQDEEKYDLIISNPPYLPPLPSASNSEAEKISEARKKARFYDSLPFNELIEGASKLLSETGIFSVIIPFSEENNFIQLAKNSGLYTCKITRVRGHKNSAVKRSLLSFSFKEAQPEIDELILEISRHNYTEAYKDLVQAFYLKL